ncbi:extracellular solute-binding protein [Paenibacillus arenilitoris]|uniref:Extracellular solute-binding protein n=1 Tax=Paenibacillus arenilitoris TaxID=2772299 RepID=A0A927CFX9_9BACL|nr:extracellular solute-binding protein [Paenibacillus arenilitoris]MBD2867359.1 extracellular solute-binding protein [Paenibacillus arenilitoris]
MALGLGLLAFMWPSPASADDDGLLVKLPSYRDYLKQHEGKPAGGADIVLKAGDYAKAGADIEIYDDYEGMEGESVYTGESGSIEWEVDVPESGMYNIEVLYYPVLGKGNAIERMVTIDGQVPYNEAKYIHLSRIWKDMNEIGRDFKGNDLRPKQTEAPRWRKETLQDMLGYYNDPLLFYLEKGQHTVGFESVREPVVLNTVRVYKAEELKSYEEVKAEYEAQGYEEAEAETIKIQAQNTYEKSDNTLYPIADRSSAITEPQDPSKLRLNSIGGDKWKMPGQWITYKFTVEEDGLYKIASRFKQNKLAGMYVNRKIMLDGAVPFKEAGAVKFNYGRNWQVEALGDGEREFAFYLEAGEHELTMEVTLGELAEVLNRVDDSLVKLNGIYRQVLMITGTEPDLYRDYGFEKLIPEAIASMKEQAAALRQVSADMEALVGQKGENMVLLDKIAFQLEQMVKDPEANIAKTFTPFKENVGALGTWILTVGEQPLTVDYMSVMPPSEKLPKAEASFWKRLAFEFTAFLMSFFADYNTLSADGGQAEEPIEVWLSSGRDQSQIIREMINDTFTPETGIQVKLKLIPDNTLLPSVLAGIGPDVAMGNLAAEPVQYALRSAAEPIDRMPGYEEIAARFHASSLVPYELEGRIYALPETQSFPMLFYRKDILQELGLEVPTTWEQFYKLIPEIQKQNMQIGFPQDISGLQIFLYQNGAELYNAQRSKSTLGDDATIEAFQKQTELFTTYKFPRDYDFANRFRTGEMPIGIADYTTYNQLIAFAPEIRGLWEFVPLPGTVMADGTLNRATPSTGTAIMMMKDAADKDKAWRYMDWWTSAETQSRFGTEMEAILGKAAKQATANMEALNNMPWTKTEYDHLMTQWSFATGTPEVPGGYYVTRNIGFASALAYTNADPETLLDYVKEVDDEITRKRREFKLE